MEDKELEEMGSLEDWNNLKFAQACTGGSIACTNPSRILTDE